MKLGWRLKGSLIAMALVALAVALLVAADVGCALGGGPAACTGVTALARAVSPWQTLLTAALALMAAVFAGWYVLLQVTLAERQEAGRIQRRFRAQTAVMPLVLSMVSDYVERSVETYRHAYGLKASGQDLTRERFADVEFPELDPALTAGLRDMIEASPEAADVSAYVLMLSDLQTHAARWRLFRAGLDKGDNGPNLLSIGTEIAEAAALYALAANLFDAVRPQGEIGQAERAPTTVVQSLLSLGVYETVPEAYAMARAFDAPV